MKTHRFISQQYCSRPCTAQTAPKYFDYIDCRTYSYLGTPVNENKSWKVFTFSHRLKISVHGSTQLHLPAVLFKTTYSPNYTEVFRLHWLQNLFVFGYTSKWKQILKGLHIWSSSQNQCSWPHTASSPSSTVQGHIQPKLHRSISTTMTAEPVHIGVHQSLKTNFKMLYSNPDHPGA